jgi:hypothetical protein
MGYKREAPVFKLVFDDPEFDGLEVRAKSMPLGAMFEFQALQERADKDASAALEVLSRFAGVLVSWNLEDDQDQPVPCNLDGLKTLDMPFVLEIVKGWMTAVASVPKAPLTPSSAAGTSVLERSIAMDVS